MHRLSIRGSTNGEETATRWQGNFDRQIPRMELTTARLLLCLILTMMAMCRGQDVAQDWMQCTASSCKCKWVSGKKTAECMRQNLTQVPQNLSSEIQSLDLTGNRIPHLIEDIFKLNNLVNLHKLVLRECGIETVHPKSFRALKIIIEIDLSANNIRTLHPGTFVETLRLRVLLLNQNKLRALEDGLFFNLTFLQKVEVSDNRLERIEEKTFRNLPGLQSLTLDGNNLSVLKLHSFENLPKLNSLELQNNPWNCNCRLKRFRDWTIERKLYTKPNTCQQPANLAGKMWDEVSSDDFACRPEIFVIGPAGKLEIGQGDAKLWCRATGIPRPQLVWVHRSKVLNNQSRRHNGERGYIIESNNDWLNLTIPDIGPSDKGDYVCLAKNPGGSVEKNVTLSVVGDPISGRDSTISLPLAIGLGIAALLLLLVTVTLCACYCRRRRDHHDEKGLEAVSLEHHSLGEQEKSLITTINTSSVKTARRYEAPSVTSHGTEMTELNRTLLDNDSVFADGVVGSGVIGNVVGGGLDEEREEGPRTTEFDNGGAGGTLSRVGSGTYRQYPPDLLAFSGGRGASPTSQASTAPDNTRLPSQQHQPQQQQQQQQHQQRQHSTSSPTSLGYNSPPGQYPATFKTLPHNRSVTPYGLAGSAVAPVMPRHGYVTIPRRPRAPSWSSGPPTSPTDALEPVYDNLGLRTTADGSSVLSLNKSPETGSSVRGRQIPGTPTSHYATMQRSTPNILAGSSNALGTLDRSAPEGAPEAISDWSIKLADETLDISSRSLGLQQQGNNTLGRKIPPRPPPKPKKKSTNGPLYEDEDEDGTEV
ncbi:uncharacterized protein LOC124427343 isoform X2 [Vespa crabro]|nr:uncharacterized protein LOC124427343 isoform X2 [Vespa crabro]XP_046826144.1 uncharacterized protein LOC124427343 isoform X2 [Vespa crabro]XP_046826153.1 uncharacterized protein LOC124427343 isoform X2 [Vespa crabro]XP_046826164.1 uncharacterized protein LOC124427343 isoform X2 [Vespa crabro]XP_046826174.1 uncharacterized protein LOC124427343 isoform X2 [Vespa crabro]XP_046826182.1 uncharacterized protein LOC124427343 isoform X2 [Vespa crabro]XP_046826191.1 uncharacterized protein LOC12442